MAVTPKSPGVYIDEISVLPPSVAPVATGIPAFVGYTDIALDENGASLTMKPKRITSMLEFERFFGKANDESVTVTVDDTLASGKLLNRQITVSLTPSDFKLYYSMQLYFGNGGGPCWIVSVDDFTATPSDTDINAGIDKLEKIDEPTLIVFPDAVSVSNVANYGNIVVKALTQSAKLQDRFVIADVYDNESTATEVDVALGYREKLGMNNLKYGAAYAPFLNTTLGYQYDDAAVTVNYSVTETVPPTAPVNTTPSLASLANTPLYGQISNAIRQQAPVVVPPSGAIAGVYAAVDRDRGVWKAPANVSLNLVSAPSKFITTADQDDLNITSTGKSINAIRAFAGKGTLVWGARTLAGNDNEWRYVNVRRLFNFMEESIKKATESVVFEPNDANTWLRVKGTITNFLTNLWRDGALVGAKPEQAFFVKVGLNETMTAQDILEGKLIIQIGAAASRPAEFIVLQFMHKLQES